MYIKLRKFEFIFSYLLSKSFFTKTNSVFSDLQVNINPTMTKHLHKHNYISFGCFIVPEFSLEKIWHRYNGWR